MEKEELQKELDKFRNFVINESKKNLTRLKKNSSKKLLNSIKGVSKLSKNSIELSFSMEDYGLFQDKGVSGTKKKYSTPYSYTTKMPPPKALDKWIVKRGIAPRNKDGKFISRSSIKFAIARSIMINGIKPTLFFTKPFDKAFKKLPNEIIEKYGLDALALFNRLTKEIYKK